ncbi:DinB family protein [Kovacikia minuta]|uniref:DinB family protein n=1 Tax=Kovacikia minuta TaxID=2931930 RepID=UPI0020C753D1
MAYNNAWANYRLLRACNALSQDDFVATRTSFFPSIKATLNHNLTVDWYYLDAMERSDRNEPVNEAAWQFFDPEEPFETCQELQIAQQKTDQRLIEFCKTLTDTKLDHSVNVPRQDGIYIEPLSRLLNHLFQHQIHHRGQVHAMLSGTLIEPPQLDEFFCISDTKLRENDFRQLGFSEAEIWGITPHTPHPTPHLR